MGFRIIIIGAGGVATHLSLRLKECNFHVVQVFSRTFKSASELGQKLSVPYTHRVEEIDSTGDLYLLAINDSAIEKFLDKGDFKNKTLVHCSGSLPLDVLTPFTNNAGVLYPLQTFTKDNNVDVSKVPFFVEGSNNDITNQLKQIAEKIGARATYADSRQRRLLHISAVFSCNFVNHLYSIAAMILEDNNMSFDYLQPLISETVKKAIRIHPHKAQTGPAVRNDRNILEMHMNEMSATPSIAEIYSLMSEHIRIFHQKK